MQLIQIYRTRFRSGILAEFLPPEKTNGHNKVAIVISGQPGYPGSKRDLLMRLSRKGYFTFVPRFKGTWESEGTFLEASPHEDIISMIDELPLGFRDIWSTAEYRIHNPEVYLIGASFGGAAAILASRDPRVKKAAAISPVTDWREQEHTVEPLDMMNDFVEKAFGPAYRSSPLAWKKLARGDFYNPVHEQSTIDGSKLLLIHAKDDRVVHFEPAEKFAKETKAKFIALATGGHMGVSSAHETSLWKHIEKFFNAK